MTAYKRVFRRLWGWPPTVVDDMTVGDFKQCKADADAQIRAAREQAEATAKSGR